MQKLGALGWAAVLGFAAAGVAQADVGLVGLVPGLPGAKFVAIRPGTFIMGSPDWEIGRGRPGDSDETQHEVTLTRGFEIQTTEVTQAQYFEVMGANPSNFKKREHCPQTYLEISGVGMCPNLPVEEVSYEDVLAFIEKLNGSPLSGAFTYRLPTEAEWEYAARAGTQTTHPFGYARILLDGYAVYNKDLSCRWFPHNDFGRQSAPVGSKRPNPWGLYDMHGNVTEWVADWYDTYPRAPVVDPVGPTWGGRYRVLRGGSWYACAYAVRSANRAGSAPYLSYGDLGFRLVRTPR